VSRAGMLLTFLQHFRFGLATSLKVAVKPQRPGN
jgi:hypothetical protein